MFVDLLPFPLSFFISFSVSWGCLNNATQTCLLRKAEMHLLSVPKTRSVKLRCQQDWSLLGIPGECCFLFLPELQMAASYSWHPLACSLVAASLKHCLYVLFFFWVNLNLSFFYVSKFSFPIFSLFISYKNTPVFGLICIHPNQEWDHLRVLSKVSSSKILYWK